MSAIDPVLRGALKRCDQLAAGVDELLPVLQPVMPLDVASLADLTFEQRTVSLAYLKRFEQLQDMLARLARTILAWQGDDPRPLSQRDVANWMERHAIVPNAADWMEAVLLRNRLVHEYPMEESEQVARVNASWKTMVLLRSVHLRMIDLLKKEGFE